MMDTETTTLPAEFIQRLERIVPEERLSDVLQSFVSAPATAFRINILKDNVETVLASLREDGITPKSVDWYRDAFWVPPSDREALLASSAAEKGRIYIQNLSSMLPPLILAPEPGEKVLDLTAAPGSKTLQLAALMQGEGELAAVELSRGRFFKMKALLQEYGASFVRTFLQNGEKVWRYRPEHFDRILLDAPCSTEGRFHLATPDTFSYWSPRKIKEMSSKQRRLLFSAIHTLKPGGVLVYSTCTFAPEENEAMIDWALNKFGDAIRVDAISLPFSETDDANAPATMEGLPSWDGREFEPDVRHTLRILPNHLFEGFYVARIAKTASTMRGE